MQGIYKIYCDTSDKCYIGSSSDIEVRWQQHLSALRRQGHKNPHLQSAWDKYGEENFLFEVIEEVNSFEELRDREQKYLDEGLSAGLLYNINELADCPPSRKGAEMSLEARANISKNNGKGMLDKKHTPETRTQMSKSQIERFETHDHPFLGEHHTQETKDKISQTLTGKKQTSGAIAKRVASLRAVYKTRSHLNKGKTGLYQHTQEAKQKIREARSKPHPAFYNINTHTVIPPGIGLRQMCAKYNLNYGAMGSLNRGDSIQSQDGWRVAGSDLYPIG